MNAEGANAATRIGERDYTGHALDRMQGSNITPSVVEDTVQRGVKSEGLEGASVYTTDQLTVVLLPNGGVKTVIPK